MNEKLNDSNPKDPKDNVDQEQNQSGTITLEKIDSQSFDIKKEKVQKIVKNNIFTTVDLKKHKRNKSSIFVAIFGVIVVLGLIIGFLTYGFLQ